MKVTMKKFFKKASVSMMILVMLGLNIQIPTAQAAIINTNEMIQQQSHAMEREKIIAFLNRAEVQQQLQDHGVAIQNAQARVANLSDAEVEMLAGNIDQLPAGAGPVDSLIGTALFVFILLLITDILGLTDAFSFVHPIR